MLQGFDLLEQRITDRHMMPIGQDATSIAVVVGRHAVYVDVIKQQVLLVETS